MKKSRSVLATGRAASPSSEETLGRTRIYRTLYFQVLLGIALVPTGPATNGALRSYLAAIAD